jgi:hypothetical protein
MVAGLSGEARENELQRQIETLAEKLKNAYRDLQMSNEKYDL